MTTMISELYEALINAGATEEKAREAGMIFLQAGHNRYALNTPASPPGFRPSPE